MPPPLRHPSLNACRPPFFLPPRRQHNNGDFFLDFQPVINHFERRRREAQAAALVQARSAALARGDLWEEDEDEEEEEEEAVDAAVGAKGADKLAARDSADAPSAAKAKVGPAVLLTPLHPARCLLPAAAASVGGVPGPGAASQSRGTARSAPAVANAPAACRATPQGKVVAGRKVPAKAKKKKAKEELPPLPEEEPAYVPKLPE